MPPKASTGLETVLVVEDEEAQRRLVRRVLESSGYRVMVAANGAEALVVAERHDGAIDLHDRELGARSRPW